MNFYVLCFRIVSLPMSELSGLTKRRLVQCGKQIGFVRPAWVGCLLCVSRVAYLVSLI